MRNNIALFVCIAAALLLGYFYVFHDRSASVTLWELSLVWFNVAWWLGGVLGRILGLRPREIREQAQRGRRLTGLALGIERAALVLLLAAGVLFFAR